MFLVLAGCDDAGSDAIAFRGTDGPAADPDPGDGGGATPGDSGGGEGGTVDYDDCDEALELGGPSVMPGSTLEVDGVLRLPESADACEDLQAVLGDPPKGDSQGEVLCDGTVAGPLGLTADQIEFITWEGDDGTECGCACVACQATYSPIAHDAIGSGTPLDPYEISNHHQLADLAANPGSWGSDFVQCRDIDLNVHYQYGGSEFFIGAGAPKFTGSYDGLGHTIDGFRLEAISQNTGRALFGQTQGAVIRNLHLTDVIVDMPDAVGVGALIGSGNGLVEHVSVEGGTITGKRIVGGLAGAYGGTMSHAESNVEVFGGDRTGGLIGSVAEANLSSVAAFGDVSARPGLEGINNDIGGLVGRMVSNSLVRKCEAHGNVSTGEEALLVGGGLIGTLNNSTVERCFATGTVNVDRIAGGLLGQLSLSSVSWSYATGNVNAKLTADGWSLAGGFIGNVGDLGYYDVSNCFARGNVKGGIAGGFTVAHNPFILDPFEQTIDHCYASGNVEGSLVAPGINGSAGAFAAFPEWVPPDITNSFSFGTAVVLGDPWGGVPFSNSFVSSSNFFNEDVWPGGFGFGAQPASAVAGDFQEPNDAPMFMGWPQSATQWDFSGALPTIPSAGAD